MKDSITMIRTTLFLLFLSLGPQALAQDNVGEESTVRYPAAYFTEWAPVTAQDMMDRIPGLSTGSGFSGSSRGRGGPPGKGGGSSGGRGFGSGSGGSEILINGKRTAGKNNSTDSQLGRITADQVDYIDSTQ